MERIMEIRKSFVKLLLVCGLLFSSCSYYTELRDNPRYKGDVIAAPATFTGIMATEENGVVTLKWSQVDGADYYAIYCIQGNDTGKKTESYLKENARLIYSFQASHIKNDEPVLEISNLAGNTQYNFFIKTVSTTGSISVFSREYVSIYSGNISTSGVLRFREL